MRSTKYGSMERYLLATCRAARRRGWRNIVQYEAPPATPAFREALAASDAPLLVADTDAPRWRAVPGLLLLLLRLRPQVIHAHFVNNTILAVLALCGRLCGARQLLVTVHGHRAYRGWHPVALAYRRFDRVYPVSKAVAADLRRAGVPPTRIEQRYLGLPALPTDLQDRTALRHVLALPEAAPVIICIAYDAPFKGVDVLIDAIPLLRHRDAHVLHLGIDPQHSDLAQRVRDLGIDDRWHWAGIRDEAWRFLPAADLLVQPSRAGEGLPLSIMEAMQVGVPIVATTVSGNCEAIDDDISGRLCRPEDPAALAAAIDDALADPTARRRWADAARRRCATLFNAERSADELARTYRS